MDYATIYLCVNLYLIQFVTWGRSKRICCRLIEVGALAEFFQLSELKIQTHSEPSGQPGPNRRAVKKLEIKARQLKREGEMPDCQIDGSRCNL